MNNQSAAIEIIRALREYGHQAFLVGGCVRDMLLNRKPAKEEHDVATSARVEEVVKIFPKTLLVGAKFGVVLVGKGGHWIEVASFRSDESYSDGRHPDSVRLGTMQEDAERRDFTVNGMYYDPITNQLTDLVDGREDIDRRIIRAIGNPDQRFREDHLRMLRAVRFAGQLTGFQIEQATAEAIRRQAAQILDISMERILEEFKKLFPSRGRVHGLRLADQLGLLQHILPEVHALHNVPADSLSSEFSSETLKTDAFEQTFSVIERLAEGTPFEIVMAGLLHLIGLVKEKTLTTSDEIRPRISTNRMNASAHLADAICRRLTCSNQERTDIVWLVQLLPLFGRANQITLAQLKRLMLYGRFTGLIALYRARVEAGLEPRKNLDTIEQLAGKVSPESLKQPPLIGGDDLTGILGLSPGPAFQKILDTVYDAQLNEEITTKDEALTLARQLTNRF